MFKFYEKLNELEKRTFLLHFLYSVIDGYLLGILALNEFVFIKGVKGSEYQLGVLFQFSIIALLLAVFFNEQIKKVGNKKRLIIATGFITRLPLLLFFFFPTDIQTLTSQGYYHYIFLGIFLLFFLSSPIVFPLINLFLRKNYRKENFGKLYSINMSTNKGIMLVVTFSFGIILDYDNFSFTYIYPIAGILGIVQYFMLSKIAKNTEKMPVVIDLLAPIKKTIRIFKKNKPYRDFEVSFTIYGFGFMISYPVITIFYDKFLHLNYTSVAFYKNSFNIVAILLLPILGSLLGKMDPRKFGKYSFLSLLLFVFFTGLTQYFDYSFELFGIKLYYTLLIAVLFNGIFAATMTLLWNIGSSYFGNSDEADDYQAVHLSLTGMRGMIAPLLGVYFYDLVGFSATFGIAIFILFLAMLFSEYSLRKHKNMSEIN